MKTIYRLKGARKDKSGRYPLYVGCTEAPIKQRCSQHWFAAHGTKVHYKWRVPQVKGHSNVIIERVPRVNTPLAHARRAGDIDPRRDWHILERVDVDDAARHENAWIAQFRRDRTYRVLNVRRSNQSLLCGYH